MKLGMVGLGKMGGNMAHRLMQGEHEIVGFAPSVSSRNEFEGKGGESAASLDELITKLPSPRVVWLMLPAGEATETAIILLFSQLEAGDTIIDGGNSNYKDTVRRADAASKHHIHYVDCGTSGGIWGLKEGYCLMIGGEKESVEPLRSLFETLAPAKNRGWAHVGPNGAGHYTKMIHNGIEYGLMQAYAEGFSILNHKTEFELDLQKVAEVWRYGSVVRSWLLDLIADALGKNPTMQGVAPYVEDSGEGRWTVNEAIELNLPAPVITLALLERLRSRDTDSFSDKLLASMRNEFGGHLIKTDQQ